MKDREKEIKYEMYLIKREMLGLKKRLINLKTELNSLNENQTRTRKLAQKKNKELNHRWLIPRQEIRSFTVSYLLSTTFCLGISY